MFSDYLLPSYRLCRCCHAESKRESMKQIFRNLDGICVQIGEKYSQMIKDSIGIHIKPYPEHKGTTYTICRACIDRLKDVAKFKKQVLDCEKLFCKQFSKDCVQEIEIKSIYSLSEAGEIKEEKVEIKEEKDDIEEEKVEINEGKDDIEEEKVDSKEEKVNSKEKDDNIENKVETKENKKLLSSLLSRNGLVIKKVANENKSKVSDSKVHRNLRNRKHERQKDISQSNNQHLIEISIDTIEKVEGIIDTLSISSDDTHTENHELLQNKNDANDDFFGEDNDVNSDNDDVHISNIDYFGFPRYDNSKEENDISEETSTSIDKQTVNQTKPSSTHRFCCEYCSYMPKSMAMLKRHLRVHTKEAPYTCDICKKSFAQKGTLSTHIVLHTGKRPNKCDVCGRGFSQRSNLNSHIKYFHNKVREYVCPICNSPIANKSDLVKHLRRTHKIDDVSVLTMNKHNETAES